MLIPVFGHDGQLVRVKVRRWEGEPRYCALPGSSTAPLVAGQGPSVVVVESELDALLLAQEAGDLVQAIALGSAQLHPDAETWAALKAAKAVLVALDNDQAGAKAAWGWWRENLPNALRWPPLKPYKDPTEMLVAGVDLRAWVELGLEELFPPAASVPETLQVERSLARQGVAHPLSPAQSEEIIGWPVETQRVYVAALERFESQGHGLAQAEALAYATVKALMERHGGPVGFKPGPALPSLPAQLEPKTLSEAKAKARMLAGKNPPANLPEGTDEIQNGNGCHFERAPRTRDQLAPVEVAPLVAMVKEVFSPGVEVAWQEEEPAPIETRCGDCRQFLPSSGDAKHGLGLCRGQPHDGHKGQWPSKRKTCRSFIARAP